MAQILITSGFTVVRKETVDKRRGNTANRGLPVNALKYLSIGLLLLLAGCATKNNPSKLSGDNTKRRSERPWYAPDIDSEERSFFYDSFLH
jgi:hypothetical protein